jgi:hypothetical protein
MEQVKEDCEILIASDTMDKSHALGIMRIQHAMESSLLVLEHEKQTEINELNYQIRLLQNKSVDLCKLQEEVKAQKETQASMDETLKKVENLVETMFTTQAKYSEELMQLIKDFQTLQDDFLKTKTEFKHLLAHVSTMKKK